MITPKITPNRLILCVLLVALLASEIVTVDDPVVLEAPVETQLDQTHLYHMPPGMESCKLLVLKSKCCSPRGDFWALSCPNNSTNVILK